MCDAMRAPEPRLTVPRTGSPPGHSTRGRAAARRRRRRCRAGFRGGGGRGQRAAPSSNRRSLCQVGWHPRWGRGLCSTSMLLDLGHAGGLTLSAPCGRAPPYPQPWPRNPSRRPTTHAAVSLLVHPQSRPGAPCLQGRLLRRLTPLVRTLSPPASLSDKVLGDRRLAAASTLLLILNPASVFHASAYSEAPFLAATVIGLWALYCIGSGPLAAAAFAASAALRSNGAACWSGGVRRGSTQLEAAHDRHAPVSLKLA
jgi:hypothetical protein